MVLKDSSYKPSTKLIERIERFYSIYGSNSIVDNDSKWCLDNATMATKKDIHKLLLSKSSSEIKKTLSDPGSTDLFYGADNLSISILKENQDRGLPASLRDMDDRTLCKQFGNYLTSLAYVKSNTKELLFPRFDMLDKCINVIENDFSGKFIWAKFFKDERGFCTDQGRMVCFRTINAFFHSIYCLRYLKSFNCTRFIEIGGGIGRTLINISNQKIESFSIDLPLSLVAQALYISAAIGEDKFLFENEVSKSYKNDIIYLMTPNSFAKIVNETTFVLNVDSLTEMDQHSASEYVQIITSKSSCFLSINHEENNFTVNHLFRNDKKPLVRYEDSNWKGYMHELFYFYR